MMLPDQLDLLLVEHDPVEAELILRPLADELPGERMAVARDGEEALDYLLGRGPYRHRLGLQPPRLVLLELRLPRLDGMEVLRALRASARGAGIPVVVLSSSAEWREIAQCYQAGANSCIRKPVDFRELRQALQEVGRYWLRVNRTAGAGAAAG